MGESNVLRACRDYLEFGGNQGKWIWFRMNSGTVFPQNRDGTTRRVNLCPEGTADLLVIRGFANEPFDIIGFQRYAINRGSLVLWVETKHKGKQTESQKAFQSRVEAQGCRYLIVTDVDQLQRELEG